MRAVSSRVAAVGLTFVLAGCGADKKVGITPLPSDDGGTDDGDAGDAGDGGGNPILAHCRIDGQGDGDADTDDAGETGGGFKFDTAPPPGGDGLPPTCDEVADTKTNLGCRFWAVDLPNDSRGTPNSPPAADQQFAVVVANSSSLQTANVSVFMATGATPIASAAVAPDATHTFALAPLNIDAVAPSVDGLAFRIEADVPVTAYQFNPLDNTVPVYSNDASVLLPEHALASDYTAVTAHSILLGSSPDDNDPVLAPAFISVVGIEDGTTVDVSATGQLLPGPVSQTIDRGQVYTLMSDLEVNLSGSRIVADAPVAVFSGNVATNLPRQTGGCCADHIEQQMVPTASWGTSYAAVPPSAPNGSSDPAEYRIMAAFDGTELLYCPRRPAGAPSQLDAGEGLTFVTGSPFTVSTADPDAPILVTQYLLSQEALDNDDATGDPAMILLAPTEQHEQKTVFAVPNGYARNYVSIYGPRTDVLLDGEPIPAGDFEDTGVIRGREYVHVRIRVEAGNHVVESSLPVGVSVYGFDEAVSYGFPGGTGVRIVAPVPPVG